MRKVSIILVVVLALAVTVVFAGCGCSDNSNSSNNQSNTTNQTATSSQTSSTNSTNSGSTTSLEQRKNVKPEDYINGKNFDLTAYAEALGYTKLDDPKGCTVYAIKRDNTKYFFSFADDLMIVWADCNDGFTYQTDPLVVTTSSDAFLIDTGAKEGKQELNQSGLDRISQVLSYISTADHIDINTLPVFKIVFKLEGSPKYYPNGVIQETSSKIVETIHVNNP